VTWQASHASSIIPPASISPCASFAVIAASAFNPASCRFRANWVKASWVASMRCWISAWTQFTQRWWSIVYRVGGRSRGGCHVRRGPHELRGSRGRCGRRGSRGRRRVGRRMHCVDTASWHAQQVGRLNQGDGTVAHGFPFLIRTRLPILDALRCRDVGHRVPENIGRRVDHSVHQVRDGRG